MEKKENIFARLPDAGEKEEFLELLNVNEVLIERIVSFGQKTEEGKWLEQERGEWVILLKGYGEIRFEGEKTICLHPGDHIFIPARKRHRVEKTDASGETVWLAVHIGERK